MTHPIRFTLVILLFVAIGCVRAQPYSLQIQNVDVSKFPKISLQVVTKNNLLYVRDLDSTKLTLREDGISHAPLRLNAPQGKTRFSAALLTCSGNSFRQNDLDAAKSLFDQIVQTMDGVLDEAAVVTYDNVATTVQNMTTSKNGLQSAITNLTIGTNSNLLWDGIYNALEALKFGGSKRTLVVVTNGRDDGSKQNYTAVAQKAKSVQATVFVLGVSVTASQADLQKLCNETGGEYSTNLAYLTQRFLLTMRGTPEHYFVEYTSTHLCRDGADRRIFLEARIDTGRVSKDTVFSIAGDPTTVVTTHIGADSVTATSEKDAIVPMSLQTAVTGQWLVPGQWVLEFDTSKVKLQSIAADGNLGKDNQYAIQPTATGATIGVTGTSVLSGKGVLFRMTFRTIPTTQNVVVPIQLRNITFTGGCLNPVLHPGRITITPKKTEITAKSQLYVFAWDDAKKDYNQPQEVKVEVSNSGDFPVSHCTATLVLQDGVKLVGGSVPEATVVPSTLQPGQIGYAKWQMKVQPRSSDATLTLDVIARCAENVTADTRMLVNVRAATSAVAGTLKVDTVTSTGGVWTPKPVPVRLTIVSAGSLTGPSGQATLLLPNGVTLASGTATQNFSGMAPGGKADLTWMVDYPTGATDTTYPLAAVIEAMPTPNDTLRANLVVPGASTANIVSTCPTPPEVTYNAVTKSFEPSPYVISGGFRNTGNAPSAPIVAELDLPSGWNLAPGETASKSVTPSLAAGDSVTVTWTLVLPAPTCTPDTGRLQYRTAITCPLSIALPARPNAAPVITGHLPIATDTLVSKGDEMTFSVTATDADQDDLTYAWTLNGLPVGTDAPSFTRTFADQLPYDVVCTVTDPCGEKTRLIWTLMVTGTDRTPHSADGFTLVGNYPNPFNPGTTVVFVVPDGRHAVTLDVTDLLGRQVRTVLSSVLTGGEHRIATDFTGLPSGSYFIRLRSAEIQLRLPVRFGK